VNPLSLNDMPNGVVLSMSVGTGTRGRVIRFSSKAFRSGIVFIAWLGYIYW
jgi:hypothetical protein